MAASVVVCFGIYAIRATNFWDAKFWSDKMNQSSFPLHTHLAKSNFTYLVAKQLKKLTLAKQNIFINNSTKISKCQR